MEITEETMIIHHGAASILAVSIEKKGERERLEKSKKKAGRGLQWEGKRK